MSNDADLAGVLERINLSQYHDTLVDNGFDDWRTVSDITEEDLERLGFKMGHKRKLQREIATLRGTAAGGAIPLATPSSLSAGSETSPPMHQYTPPSTKRKDDTGKMEEKTVKRRYRRHPRPDPKAPKRPKTAYVKFADHIRSDPAVSAQSFVQIAKIVGRRWQDMDPRERATEWEEPAALEIQEWEKQMERYKSTAEHQTYQAYLEDFRNKNTPPARPSVPELPPALLASTSSSSASQSAQDHSPFELPNIIDIPDLDTQSSNDNSQLAIDQAIGELSALLSGPVSEVQTYDHGRLPPREIMDLVLNCFFEGTGNLFFVYTRQEVRLLIDKIYQAGEKHDNWALLDLLAIAAVGSYYDINFPGHMRRSFYFSCLQILDKLKTANYLRCMRLFTCLALYCTLEKSSRAWSLIGAAHQIGRLKLPLSKEYGPDYIGQEEYWRKVFRSVIFIECWLSYSLGYKSVISPRDVEYVCHSSAPEDPSIEDSIQDQATKVGLLAAEISLGVTRMTQPNVRIVKHHMEKLNQWHQDLPRSMHLRTLNSEHAEVYSQLQKRSILLVHMLFLGAVTFLHRHVLVAVAESRLTYKWVLDASSEEVRGYQDYCVFAAHQAARIAGLLQSEGSIPRHCWVAINQTYNACCILLYSASQKLLHLANDGLQEDLASANNCINLLSWCSTAEGLASRYTELVRPIYQALLDISNKSSSTEGVHNQTAGDYLSTVPLEGYKNAEYASSVGQQAERPTQNISRTRDSAMDPVIRQEVLLFANQVIQLLLDPFGSVDNPQAGFLGSDRTDESSTSAELTWWD